MKRICTLFCALLLLVSCQEVSKENKSKDIPGNLVLQFPASVSFDSVEISTQSDVYHKTADFSAKMGFKTPVPLPSDLYKFTLYDSTGVKTELAWLNGQNVFVSFSGSSLKIDSVANSPLYKEAQKFSSQYKNYMNSGYPVSKIRQFMWSYTKANKNNPFSLLTAQLYFRNNFNNKQNLKKVLHFLQDQEKDLIDHPLNPMDQIKHQIRELSKNKTKNA